MRARRILIRDAIAVTMADSVADGRRASRFVEGDRIAALGPDLPALRARLAASRTRNLAALGGPDGHKEHAA